MGRDAYRRVACKRPSLAGLGDTDCELLTEAPRWYGFHATLKAPFELSDGQSEAALLSFAKEFAQARYAFDVQFAVRELGSFLALMIDAQSDEMQEFHCDAVKAFEPFRGALSEEDLERRRKSSLTTAQESHLQSWGYPYIFDDFRFHMTLTGRIGDPDLRRKVQSRLSAYFSEAIESHHRVDGVAVFYQPDRETSFHVVGRFDFAR